MHVSPRLTCKICCMQARAFLLQALGQSDAPSSEKRKQIGLISKQHLALSAPVLAVLESPLLFDTMGQLMVRVLICTSAAGAASECYL